MAHVAERAPGSTPSRAGAWRDCLRGDPVAWLLHHSSVPVRYRTYSDLLEDESRAAKLRDELAGCPDVQVIFARQLPGGGWFREGYLYHRNGPEYGFGAIQQLNQLADFGMTLADSRVQRAVDCFLSFRTPDGRFFWTRKEIQRGRGEYGCHLAMFYEGCTVRALLCLGVPESDLRVNLDRICSLQLADGSWAVRYGRAGRPLRRRGVTDDPLDRIWGTTLALSALQASTRAHSACVLHGSQYLLNRLFAPQISESPSGVWFYYSLRYPDFYASVLRSLEAAARAGAGLGDPRLLAGVEWLRERQSSDGPWHTWFAGSRRIHGYGHIVKNHAWVTFRALRVIKLAYGNQ